MHTRAEQVSFDANRKRLELAGNVRVDAAPFHLRSEHLILTRQKYGLDVDGEGRLAFCPCLGTPLTIEFKEAIVAPPGDLFLKDPKLEFYGVPVFWVPWFWMRSDEKKGLLPPEIAYRGQDGLYLGEGVHLPWREHGDRETLDLRGGGYFEGGFVADARLRTPSTATTLRWDRLHGDDGVLVDARGALVKEDLTVAWDADVLRGQRGVVATTDLDAAARPYDRGAVDAALHTGPVVTETGLRAVTRRGGDLTAVEASGPFAALRASGAVASSITYDAAVEGGALRTSGAAATGIARLPPDSVTYGRAVLGALAATNVGPIGAELRVRGAGNLATEGARDGGDRAGTVKARVGLPLARGYAVADADNDPVIHVVEPFVEGGVLHAAGSDVLGSVPGGGFAAIDGTAPIASGGLVTSLGRWGRKEGIELAGSAGAAFSATRPLARGRLSATFRWVGTHIESGHVIADGGGSVVVGTLRVGRVDGLRFVANAAGREGIDPVLARALTDAALESPAGFLARNGATGGAGFVIPWARFLSTSVGADGDATQGELVAARAGIELRDRCNCLTLRANGAHRIGRDGVDVWVALDFAADR